MKFLCLAYGDEGAWTELSKDEQDRLLAQDEVLRHRGDFVAAVETEVTTISAWGGTVRAAEGTFTQPRLPLAGFSIVEAVDIGEVIRLVADTPCAQAGGAIEIRPIAEDARAGDPDAVLEALEQVDPSATREWCSPK